MTAPSTTTVYPSGSIPSPVVDVTSWRPRVVAEQVTANATTIVSPRATVACRGLSPATWQLGDRSMRTACWPGRSPATVVGLPTGVLGDQRLFTATVYTAGRSSPISDTVTRI